MALFAHKVKCSQCGEKVKVASSSDPFVDHLERGLYKIALRCKACQTAFCQACVFAVNEERVLALLSEQDERVGHIWEDLTARVKRALVMFYIGFVDEGKAKCPSCGDDAVGFA